MKKDLLIEWKNDKKMEKLGDLQSRLENEVTNVNNVKSDTFDTGKDVYDPLYAEEQRKATKERVEEWKRVKQEEQQQKLLHEKQLHENELRRKEDEVCQFKNVELNGIISRLTAVFVIVCIL